MKLEYFIEKTISIAKQAGEEILSFYINYKNQADSSFSIHFKNDKSPVTQADLAANKLICDALNQMTPEILVVSEEDPHSWKYRKKEKLFWLIDPLDGTKEFLKKNDEFTVNIALIENGVPIFGVICVPVFHQVYVGGKNISAFRESKGIREKIQIHTKKEYEDSKSLKVIASKSHFSSKIINLIEKFELPYQIMNVGSSLKFCRVAEGGADLYPRLNPTSEWDTAAGQAILEAAGGFVIQLNGKPLKYGKSDILNPGFIAGGIPLDILIRKFRNSFFAG